MKHKFFFLVLMNLIIISSFHFGQTIGNKINAPFSTVKTLSILEDDRIFVGTENEGLFYSPDAGVTWIKITFPYTKVGRVYKSNSGDLYVSAYFNGIYRSKNETGNWQLVGYKDVEMGNMIEGSSGYLLMILSSYNSFIYSEVYTIYLSKNNGINWGYVTAPFNTYIGIVPVKHPNGDIYTSSVKGVYKSKTGEYWSYCHPGTISSIAIDADGIIYIGLEEELRTSSNEGVDWNISTFTQKPFVVQYIFKDRQENMYIETYGLMRSYLYKKVKGSYVWSLIGELNGFGGQAFGYQINSNSKGDIFYLDSGSLYKIDRTITSVHSEENSIPQQITLYQNYPNPFNPSTTISYSLPQHTFVTLKIYNNLGQELETLVNEEKSAGIYSVLFDGSRVSSGIYFYRLQTENFSQTRKFILLK